MQQGAEISPNMYPDDSAIDIDRVAGVLLRKFWIILLVAVLVASAFYLFAKALYVEEYISSSTLAFTTTKYITEKDENGKELGTIKQKKYYAEKDVDRYQFLLKSDVMVQQIYDALGNNQSKAAIEKSLSVNSTTIAGIFTVNVMSNDKEFCDDAIHAVIKIFPDYLKSFDTSIGIDVIKNPKTPVAANEDRASKKAFYGFVIGAALVIFIIFITEVSSDPIRQIDDICEKII